MTSTNPSTDDSTGSIIKPQFTLPLSSDPVHAPLASPETLSMASGILGGSVASGIVSGLSQSESLRDSLRRSLHSPPSQNSFRHSLSSPPARIDGVHVELSPGKGEGQKERNRLSGEGDRLVSEVVPVSGQSVHGKDKLVSNGTSGRTQTVSSDTAAHTRVVEDTANDSQSECKQTDPSVLPSQSLCQQLSQKQAAHSISPVGVQETCVASHFDRSMLNSLPIKNTTITNDNDAIGSPLSAHCPSAIMTAAGGERACFTTPHSPVETTQGEYEHPNLHYSQASTGYPHGAYHPPIRYDTSGSTVRLNAECSLPTTTEPQDNALNSSHRPAEHFTIVKAPTPSVDLPLKSAPLDPSTSPSPTPHPFIHCQSESSIFSKHFPPKLGMKRSAEQTDICHLEDEAEVFPANKDLFAIKRSAEQNDIAHLGDDLDVFEEEREETEDTVGNLSPSRGRLAATRSTPRSSTVGSVGQQQEVGSRHAPSSQSSRSDDVFESEMVLDLTSETDV